ncbi:hypothetical protein Leryth_012731, partial [Lithospermum erythrorhizon]
MGVFPIQSHACKPTTSSLIVECSTKCAVPFSISLYKISIPGGSILSAKETSFLKGQFHTRYLAGTNSSFCLKKIAGRVPFLARHLYLIRLFGTLNKMIE